MLLPRTAQTLKAAAIAGGALLFMAAVAACGGGSEADVAETPSSAAAPSATTTPTSPPTATATPTATPTPFAGAVASISIPSLNVVSSIQPAGVTPDNVMETPKDHLTTYWYDPARTGWDTDGSSRPGWGGNAVLSAHHSYNLQAGPFRHIADMAVGDEVVVTMENGVAYTYEVFRVEQYPEATFPSGELIWPAEKPANEEWVTLITCGGDRFVVTNPENGTGEFLDRDVIIAKRTR